MAGQSSSLADLARKFDDLAGTFEGDQGRRRLERVAKETKLDSDEAVRGTLGDMSMSGWRRAKPIDIQSRYEVMSPTTFEVAPQSRSKGLMRVLESGRKGYAAGSKRRKGSYTSKKTGATKDRFKTVKSTVGATAGKGTWTNAEQLMARRVPGRVAKALNRDMSRIFKRG